MNEWQLSLMQFAKDSTAHKALADLRKEQLAPKPSPPTTRTGSVVRKFDQLVVAAVDRFSGREQDEKDDRPAGQASAGAE